MTAVMAGLGLPMKLSSMARMMKNMTDASTSSWKCLINMALYSMLESVLSKQPSMTFLGCAYDKNGANPGTAKVSEVHNMPSPETSTQLQKFLSMVTYLSPFVPSLSSLTAPLCELFKKGTESTWNQSHKEAFDTVKCLVCTDTSTGHFNVHKPIPIQVDTSWKCLSTTLLQDGQPDAFFSKVLTLAEQHYANIEYEMHACVSGVEWFHMFWPCIHC